MKIGDKVIICSDMNGPTDMKEYTVTKVDKDTIQCGSAENTFYSAFAWPVAYADELTAVLTERARLKKAFDDSFALCLQLRNKIKREEVA
jgi:hypothetical protein